MKRHDYHPTGIEEDDDGGAYAGCFVIWECTDCGLVVKLRQRGPSGQCSTAHPPRRLTRVTS